jgi:hypothetical protein
VRHLTASLQLRDSIVGSSSGSELTIEVPNRGIWGTAGIGGKNIDRYAAGCHCGRCLCVFVYCFLLLLLVLGHPLRI